MITGHMVAQLSGNSWLYLYLNSPSQTAPLPAVSRAAQPSRTPRALTLAA